MSKESKLYKEVRIWGTKGRTDEWEVPVGSGVVAIRELQKYKVVVEEWDAWNWDYGKVIICNDKVKSVTIEVNSYVRLEDRSWDSQGIETQGFGRIIYFNTEMTSNRDEGKTKRLLVSQWLKSVRNWRWQPRLSGWITVRRRDYGSREFFLAYFLSSQFIWLALANFYSPNLDSYNHLCKSPFVISLLIISKS